MSRITTVIFDMYETLAENNPDLWVGTFGDIVRDQGLDADPDELYRNWKSLEVGFRKVRINLERPELTPPFKSYETAWMECFAQTFQDMGLGAADSAAAARKAVVDMGLREAYPETDGALSEIQGGWRTAVLSNADDDYLFPLIERMGWKFDATLSSEGAKAYKPLPETFHRILEMLGAGSEECIYVGDTLLDDVFGSKGVGMRSVWINRTGAVHDPNMPMPDYEISSLDQLSGLLRAES